MGWESKHRVAGAPGEFTKRCFPVPPSRLLPPVSLPPPPPQSHRNEKPFSIVNIVFFHSDFLDTWKSLAGAYDKQVCPLLDAKYHASLFPVAQTVKNLPAVQETPVRSLGLDDPMEKGMATHSSILAWRISWTEKPGGLQSTGSQLVGQN